MSAGLAHPLLIVGDVHLRRTPRPAVDEALAKLVERHPDHEVVLNGDSFDLSTDPPEHPPWESVARILATNSLSRNALSAHLSRGGQLTLVAGNHDAALSSPEVTDVLRSKLGAGLSVAPWFIRRGAVHIEHGHLYDPDNAPSHPLARWSLATEPLGVALTRRFVAASGVWEFAHGNETTPLAGLLGTIRRHGARAPLKIWRYYSVATELTFEAGRQPGIDEERARGALAVAELAREVGVDADALHALALASWGATHHRRGATFQRLYLDRSLATAILLAAAGVALAGSPVGAGAALLSASYLGWSISRGTNRYRGLVTRRMDDAAAQIAELTHASVVVLGHTHQVADRDGYLNPGSFAYPTGSERRFVRVLQDGSPELGAI